MTPVALALVLVSAATHAAWNAGLKRASDPAASAVWIVAGAASLSAVLAVATRTATLPSASWGWVVASGLVEAAYFVTLAGALARLPLGTAYGVARGGGQLVTWPIAVLALGEPLTATSAAGASLVAGGLLATARPGGVTPDGLGWAVACAVTIGVYPITYKAALGAGAPEATLFATSLAISLPVQIALLGAERRARLTRAASGAGWPLLAASVLCAASFLAFLGALALGGAGRASAIRNVSVLFALAIAAWGGERPTSRALFGAVGIAVGAALVAG